MIVMKFGGTSVGSPERISHVASLAARQKKNVIVVVSAMSGTTDKLLGICNALRRQDTLNAKTELDNLHATYRARTAELLSSTDVRSAALHRVDNYFKELSGIADETPFTEYEEHHIVSYGELLSSTMLYHHLLERGADVMLCNALDFMRTDNHGYPDIKYLRSRFPCPPAPEKAPHVIVTQGFICRNAFGEVSNLERGGSDYTATLIGSALNAEEIQIWTDISGLHNNDPRYVDNTSRVPHLSFDEATALAYNGAKILHPVCVGPAKAAGVPIKLLNTMRPEDEGTTIDSNADNAVVKAIAAKDNMMLLTLRSKQQTLNVSSMQMWQAIAQYRTHIHLLHVSHTALLLCLEHSREAQQLIRDLQTCGNIETEENMTVVTLVGNNIRKHLLQVSSIVSKALETCPVRLQTCGECPHTYTIVVPQKEKNTALKSLHNQLFR